MQINRQIVLEELSRLVVRLMTFPETNRIRIADVQINKQDIRLKEKLDQAVQQSYHDCYSDIDMHIFIDMMTADPDYISKRKSDLFDRNNILGEMVSQSNVYRVALRNGMRYDMVFEFQPSKPCSVSSHVNDFESIENADRFWFVQIQALGKLYRNDFLISLHLANTNLNETLVQQMVLRDIQYGTTHHRYGYQEEIEYLRYHNQSPVITGNQRFDLIASLLWSAALAYDKLMQHFHPDYQPRNACFLEIWKCYEQNRLNAALP